MDYSQTALRPFSNFDLRILTDKQARLFWKILKCMHVCLMSNSIIAFCVILAVACISIYDAFYAIDYECMNELNLGDSRWICSSIVHQKCDHSFHSSETQCFETKKLQSTNTLRRKSSNNEKKEKLLPHFLTYSWQMYETVG